MSTMTQTFRDKVATLQDGVEFYATGLVTDRDEPSPSGKDLVVEYIDLWGTFNREWRGVDEVWLSPIEEEDADTLRSALRDAEARGNL